MVETFLSTARLCRPARQNCKGAIALGLWLAACAAPAAFDSRQQIIHRTIHLEGPARVIDGDTIKVQGTVVRIHGIDAPELAQDCTIAGRAYPCGQVARRTLAALTRGPVACLSGQNDRYGRRIAICSSGGLDLGAAMVAAGWAVAYRKYSRAYVELEAEARTARRGLWAGAFAVPWQWRQYKK